MYNILLFDVDDTLLDFAKTEHFALNETLKHFGLKCNDEMVKAYNAINLRLWEKYQQGELSKERLVLTRFEEFAAMYNLNLDAFEANQVFLQNTTRGFFEIEGAKEAVIKLRQSYKIYAVTNALLSVSTARLKGSGFYNLFLKVFNSDQMGVRKPQKEFFDVVFKEIGEKDKSKYLIIGDSLSSDIQGGINAGIDTCWVNPNDDGDFSKATFEIKSVSELPELLEKMSK